MYNLKLIVKKKDKKVYFIRFFIKKKVINEYCKT